MDKKCTMKNILVIYTKIPATGTLQSMLDDEVESWMTSFGEAMGNGKCRIIFSNLNARFFLFINIFSLT